MFLLWRVRLYAGFQINKKNISMQFILQKLIKYFAADAQLSK